MDPFEVRMEFVTLLGKLSASVIHLHRTHSPLIANLCRSQSSIQKVVQFAFKYFSRCKDDLWDCLVEEFQRVSLSPLICDWLADLARLQGSINARINLFYLLDTLANTSIQNSIMAGSSSKSGSFYLDFITRDLGMLVDCVVPDGRDGLINLMSTVQVS